MPVFPPSGGGATGTPTPAPNAVPESLADGRLAIGWLPPNFSNAEVYVSPEGDDDNTGLGDWQHAKETIYEGIAALNSLGGGTLYVADGSHVGGPVANQGIWLRFDKLPDSGFFFDAPGWQVCSPMVIEGCGKTATGFQPGVTARFFGGGGDVFHPPIWIVGLLFNPFVVRNLIPGDFVSMGNRIGVDYDRELADGEIKQIDVTSATRTGTTTVYTLDVDGVTPLTVTRASRTSNVTTLTIPNPGLPWPPWRQGVPVRFVSGDGDFASGDYTISETSNHEGNNATWTISYAETGANVADKAIASSALRTHGCRAGELIDLTSSNVHFFGTQYYVNSATIDTVTVTDVFGDGDRGATANIGTIAHQERFCAGTHNVRAHNCSVRVNDYNPYAHGSWDIGHNKSIPPLITDAWYQGYVGDGTGPRDERRMAPIYVYGGTAGNLGPVAPCATIKDSFGYGGMIYFEAGAEGVCIADVRNVLHETPYVALAHPVLRVDGSNYTRVVGHDLQNADSDPLVATVELNNVLLGAADIQRAGFVKGGCVGGDVWQVPNAWGYGSVIPSPWQGFGGNFPGMHVTTWADGRITGKHPGVPRAMGVVGARFENLVVDPANWLYRLQDKDFDQPAPDGSSTAVVVHSTNTFISIVPNGATGDTWEQGGRFFVGGWINFEDNQTAINAEIFKVTTSQVTFNQLPGADTNGSIPTPYAGPGWQYVSGYLTVASVTSSTPNIEVEVRCQSGKTIGLWGMTAFYVPASVKAADAFELLGTQRHQPRYLQPGMSGTMEGVKLIAHGGIGGASRDDVTLDASPNGIVVPYYDTDGSLLGYFPLYDEAP